MTRRRDLRVWIVTALIIVVTACGSVPKPFQRASNAPPGALTELGPESAGIEIGLIDGTTLPMAKLIAQYTADAFLDRDIPAAPAPSLSSGYFLTGVAQRNLDQTGTPSVVHVHWTLRDRAGATIGTHTQGVDGPFSDWEYGSERALQDVADGTAAAVSRLILGAAADIIEGEVLEGVWVGPVRGAPGDGDRALRRALRLALKGKGAILRDTASEAAARVLGTVDLVDVDTTTQEINIVWEVLRPDGTSVGTTDQKNAIPKGSLDGPWGQVASYATAAVVDAVLGLTKRIAPTAKPENTESDGQTPAAAPVDTNL